MADTRTISASPPKPRRRWPRRLGFIAGLLLVLLVVLYFVATSSAFLQGVILPRVSKSMSATVTVSDASIHPFKEVILHNLKVQTTGTEPLVAVKEVRTRYSLMAILGGNLVIQEVTVSSPTISLVENADGTSNLDPILNSQKGKSEPPKPAPSSPGKPPQVDLKKFSLTEGTIRRVKLNAVGKPDTAEISNLNIGLDDVKNGQTGKFSLSADLKSEVNPTNGANGSMQATVKGNFEFALTQDLKPASIKGNKHLAVTRAEGAFKDLATMSADLDAEMSPTDIKQISLHFQKGDARLGELRASGPFDAAKGEGRIAVQILAIDRQALNLVGAASGMDFGPTTINSTNEIVITKAGAAITATGQLIVNKFQITKAGETTPAVDLQATYNAAVDNNSHSVSVRDTALRARLEGNPPLEANLNVEVSVQNQVTEIRQVLLGLTPTARAKNQLELKGRVDLSKPDAIQGNLDFTAESLDFTSYYDFLTANKKKSETKSSSPAAAPAGAPAAGSGEPAPQTLPLKDFTVAMNLKRVYLREVDIAEILVQTKIAGSHVEVTPCKLTLNGAPVTATTDLDLGVPGYKYAVTFGAQGIPLTPLVNSFQPERKGQIGGTLTANTQITGAGITPASLQKNLAGQFDFGTTNLNLSVANIQNPILKALVKVVTMIPDIASSPEAAVTSLLGSLLDKGSGPKGAWSDEMSKSPVDAILLRGAVSAGQVNLQNALVQSPTFLATTTGTVKLADPLTNSPIQFPVSLSLPQALAAKLHMAAADSATNGGYVKLPDFLTMKGTAGQPKTDINKAVLATAAIQGLSNIPGVGGKASGVLQGVGNLLKGGGTNAADGSKTNSPAGGLLDGLLKPKKK